MKDVACQTVFCTLLCGIPNQSHCFKLANKAIHINPDCLSLFEAAKQRAGSQFRYGRGALNHRHSISNATGADPSRFDDHTPLECS
jgi:hypothetical protein